MDCMMVNYKGNGGVKPGYLPPQTKGVLDYLQRSGPFENKSGLTTRDALRQGATRRRVSTKRSLTALNGVLNHLDEHGHIIRENEGQTHLSASKPPSLARRCRSTSSAVLPNRTPDHPRARSSRSCRRK